jgi:sugar phosphate permease
LTNLGIIQGVNYYLSCWYRRAEFGTRAVSYRLDQNHVLYAQVSQAIFFSAAALAGSFGGLLAAAIEKLDGKGGLAGWRWIFILEGLLTVVVAVASFWMVHDFPDEAGFLSDDDRTRVIRRLKLDQQSSAEHEEWSTRYLIAGLKDWKMWLGMAIYMGCDMPLYAFSLFLPTIIQESGWNTSVIRTNLLSVPPYAAAAVLTVIIGFVADRTRQRGLCNIIVSSIGIVGFILLIASNNPAVKYAATFLGALGIYPCISNTITWVANNTEGVYKRGVVLGFVIGWGNLNGIVSSNIFFDKPRYFQGHGIILAYMVLFLFGGSILMTTLLRIENKKRREGKRDYLAEGKSEAELDRMGDGRPDFFYVT